MQLARSSEIPRRGRAARLVPALSPGPWRADREVLAKLLGLVAAEGGRRRTLAAVAGRLVATRGWERLGFARLADYATERAGVSVRQLQELAHVDAALAERPGIEAALVEGRLTWTQARLLCRVARREDEAAWLALARGTSARELARQVRQVDQRSIENGGARPFATAADANEDEPWEPVRIRCDQRARGRWILACRVAERAAGQALPGWACAEVVAAEAFSAAGLPSQGPAPAPPEPAPTAPLAGAARRGPVPESIPESIPVPPASSDPPGAARGRALAEVDPFELDARLRRGLALEQRQVARIGPLLLRVAVERLYRLHGHRSFDAFARDELALSPSAGRALLRIERLALASDVFRRAWRRGRVSWTQADALAPLLALEQGRRWHAAWLARAARVTVRRLKDDVGEALARGELDPGGLAALPSGLQSGAPPRRRTARVRLRIPAPRSVARLFRAVLASVQRRIERSSGGTSSEGEAFEAMLEHALESWGLDRPLARKYAVFERDGWRCTVPGCTSYRNLQDHHIRFRSGGGDDSLENRTTLCAFHHLRGVHAGRVSCRGRAPDGLEFALGLRAGCAPLMRFTSGDRVAGDRQSAFQPRASTMA